MFEGELGSWAFIGLCVLIAFIAMEVIRLWNEKHPIKVEPKDPDGCPHYIDRNTGRMYIKYSDLILSKKFQQQCKDMSELVKKHNGKLPFID